MHGVTNNKWFLSIELSMDLFFLSIYLFIGIVQRFYTVILVSFKVFTPKIKHLVPSGSGLISAGAFCVEVA